MSDRPKEFDRVANPDAHQTPVGEGRPIATQAQLQRLEAQRSGQAPRFNAPAPPGMVLTAADYQRAAQHLENRIAHARQRLGLAQDKMRDDFQEATGSESKDREPNPYKKRMLVRREFSRVSRDNVKERER